MRHLDPLSIPSFSHHRAASRPRTGRPRRSQLAPERFKVIGMDQRSAQVAGGRSSASFAAGGGRRVGERGEKVTYVGFA